jgi:DNA-directed RNA polymerase specialized sigma24 family protein
MLADVVGRVMDSLRERDRAILALSLQGHPTAEVSTRLGCTERKVQRVLQQVREGLLTLLADERPGP